MISYIIAACLASAVLLAFAVEWLSDLYRRLELRRRHKMIRIAGQLRDRGWELTTAAESMSRFRPVRTRMLRRARAYFEAAWDLEREAFL